MSVEEDGDEAEVKFTSPAHESEIDAKLENHGLVVEVEEEPR